MPRERTSDTVLGVTVKLPLRDRITSCQQYDSLLNTVWGRACLRWLCTLKAFQTHAFCQTMVTAKHQIGRLWTQRHCKHKHQDPLSDRRVHQDLVLGYLEDQDLMRYPLEPGGGHLSAAVSPTASVQRRSKPMPTSQTCCHTGNALKQCGEPVSTYVRISC